MTRPRAQNAFNSAGEPWRSGCCRDGITLRRLPTHQRSRREPVMLHDSEGSVAIRRVTGKMPAGCASGDSLPGMKAEFKMTEADRNDRVDLPCWTCLGRTRLPRTRTGLEHSDRLVPAEGHPLDDAVLIA